VRALTKLDEDPSWLRDDPASAQTRVAARLTRFVTSCKNATVASDVEEQAIHVTLPEPCGPNRAVGRAELHFLPRVATGFLALRIDLTMNGVRYDGELVLDRARESDALCLVGRVAGGTADAGQLQRDLVWPLFPWLIFPTKYEKRGR
jgi:hypothetical protein